MDLQRAQVLITGGSEGIGYGLAERFIKSGSRVMITGRNIEKLERATHALPGLEFFTNDISQPEERETLAKHIQQTMPGLNVLINNAGIQRRIALTVDNAPWSERQQEIDTLLSGPVHMNHLLVPLLIQGDRKGVLVNVTSGGAYIPQVFAPLYSACKAALHHYTIILREALQETNCRVVELIPPAVQTRLAGPGTNHGVMLDEFCDAVFRTLISSDKTEIGFGQTAELEVAISGRPLGELFQTLSSRFPVEKYPRKSESETERDVTAE